MPSQEKPQSLGADTSFVMMLPLFLLVSVAEGYRLIFHRPGSRGIAAVGLHTPVGMVAFPVIAQWIEPPQNFLAYLIFRYGWAVMVVMAGLHQLFALIRFRHNHRHEIGVFILGRWLEPFCVAGMAFALYPVFKGGAGWLVIGYACSTLHRWVIGLREPIASGRIRDARREAEQLQRYL